LRKAPQPEVSWIVVEEDAQAPGAVIAHAAACDDAAQGNWLA
jgi:hypothetical protein